MNFLRLPWTKLVLGIALGSALPRAVMAAAAPISVDLPNAACLTCGRQPLTGAVWKHRLGVVCNNCHQHPHRCWLCELPVITEFRKTTDGRYICRREVGQIVVELAEAKQLFARAIDGLGRLAPGLLELRTTNVAVNLFDVDYWNYRDGQPVPETARRFGFSQTRSIGQEFNHTVLIQSALTSEMLTAVCAHEIGHLWINENRDRKRLIHRDTLEAICELLAFKLAVMNNQTNTQARIKENLYTNGKIQTLLDLDQKLGLPALLNWVRSGTSDSLTAESAEADESLSRAGRAEVKLGPPPASFIPAAAATRATSQLEVQAVIRTSRQQSALINGVRFEAGAEHAVTLGKRTLKIRCLEIQPNGVRVSIDGAMPRTLILGGLHPP